MKEILLRMEDSVYESFMGMVSLCPSVEVVTSGEVVDVVSERDQCMAYAINTLRKNKVFRHYYDYTWVMMIINEGQIKDFSAFKSPQAFLDYLYEIGIDHLPTRYSISLAYSKTMDTFPDWTFLDVEEASEILRRKNVAKQFLSAYGAAKRGIFNKIFNK